MTQIVHTTAHLGRLLQSARKAAGMTQATAAARLGLSQSRLSQLEANPDSLSVGRLLPIFALLGLDLVVRKRGAAPSATTSEW